jgi:hypothetical protein
VIDPNQLPPELRRQLRAKTLELLAEIGVQPKIDGSTGELLVPLEDMCRALGVPFEEAKRMLGEQPGSFFTGNPADLQPLN